MSMFEDNEADSARPVDPAVAARDKLEELRMYAELAAVFEGPRKFEAEVIPDMNLDLARQLQKGLMILERARIAPGQVLPADQVALANDLLTLGEREGLPTNDYHANHRPGQVMIVRWLGGDEVDGFFARLNAHFDSMLAGHVEDEQSARGWTQDAVLPAYLTALERGKPKLDERYLVQFVKSRQVPACLSTQTVDEMNIHFIAETVMGMSLADLVGTTNAPEVDPTSDDPEPSEADLTWYFKLFLLRGAPEGQLRTCFFAFLQKTSDEW